MFVLLTGSETRRDVELMVDGDFKVVGLGWVVGGVGG